ncbi:branched-chain amino acid ABC transporter permease [Candidatus Woesearchaeota archaeon]|nr:branched-chain amino acid ABC transporter permease [Candidatus Woesearchaeota archaeon]
MALSQLIINGIVAGAIYALVASGFSLIYSTNKFIHIAHGATIAFSGYFLYFLFSMLGINFGFSVIVSIIFATVIGYLMNILVYKQLRRRKTSSLILLIASFALLVLLESLIILLFGANLKTIKVMGSITSYELFGGFITPIQIAILITSIVLLIGLYYFMNKTKIGKALRAVSNNKNVAEVLGISSERMFNLSFIIGSGLAAVAGVLIALEQSIEPMMGTHLIIKGFTASVIGGIGNVPGAILGAFLLGGAETMSIWFLPSGYKDAITFIILFLFLVFRPKGILGKRWSE